MKIDFASLAFGYVVKVGGATPNWATSLGQGKEYKINDNPDIDELLKGMIYSSVSLSSVSSKIGKGGRVVSGNVDDSPIIVASVFQKVYVNDVMIPNGKYILLVTRDTSKSHEGRLRFKYGPSNTYREENNVYSNESFWSQTRQKFGMTNDACYFVYDISVKNQNELYINMIVVNPKYHMEYADSVELHAAWDDLIKKDESKRGINSDSHHQTNKLEDDNLDENRKYSGCNILLYGVPGSGKSHTIESNYCNDFNLMERVVFHPDYMNTDFVGQILPTVRGEGDEKEITYDFTPGPFTRVLKKAIENPSKQFYLVIEEINRGNAPAIFGEIFQLLDRDTTGTSSYKITNYNIASEVFGKKETPIYIPSNLSILATMNTADQNVFTLDTAFQRRWNMKIIENDVRKAEHARTNILDTSVTWGKFNTVVNEQIITSGSATLSSEDKRLGAYFVTKDILEYYSMDKDKNEIIERYGVKSDDVEKLERVIKDLNSRFGDKVIKYLWDDAFKFSRDDLFESGYKSLEKVLDDFGRFDGDKKFDIFNQDIKDNLFTTEESR